MPETVWLNAVFTRHWQGREVFSAAREVSGQVYRQLEQRQTLAFSVEGRDYFIKRHHGVRPAEIVKNLLTLRLPVVSARNEFNAIRVLQASGIGVPVVAAYGRRGLLPASVESFLVTEAVGAHETLEDYCRPWREQPPAFRDKLHLLQEVARIARTMHGAGVCHRDFYLCHFLRLRSSGELVLIDLHRALHKTRLGRRWIIKDLGGLYFSALDIGLTRRDLLRFMRAYRQAPLRRILAGEQGFWGAVLARALRLYGRS